VNLTDSEGQATFVAPWVNIKVNIDEPPPKPEKEEGTRERSDPVLPTIETPPVKIGPINIPKLSTSSIVVTTTGKDAKANKKKQVIPCVIRHRIEFRGFTPVSPLGVSPYDPNVEIPIGAGDKLIIHF
jgi:hypothetical protein